MTRQRPFLTYFILCAIPLLFFAALNYWNGITRVDATLSTVAQDGLNAFNAGVDQVLDENGKAVLQLALRREVRHVATNKTEDDANRLNIDLDRHFQSLALFDRDRQPLWFRNANTEWKSWNAGTRPPNLPQPHDGVWGMQGNSRLEKPGSSPSTHEFTAPVHDEGGAFAGAVVGVLDLDSVFASAARSIESRAASGNDDPSSMVVVLDQSGKIVYHSDRSLKLKPVAEVLPGFNSIATEMTANQSGIDQFGSPSGSSYLAAYSPLRALNVGVAVARNRSELISSAHQWGIAGLGLAVLTALAAAFLLERHVQSRSRGIARVTEDVSAIAKGELDRRIILQSSDDARGLADNINVMTERLRAQIAREEESRQFESFVRLSAMLTHDLKNAIEGLSLTVGNMERHFDNPQFRTDALRGLTSATDKLKALVARLARPVTSLSGEHKRPKKVDLIPVIQRVIATTAEGRKHTIVTRLPQSLVAHVVEEQIEEVLENLVLNALEAMDNGGTLTIEAAQTETGATFLVSDTGRGMSRTFIETRLFRPFSTTKKTGIGLGLYTCREVLRAN
ncbi:MAG TPA: ATP-binding protein, partial [Pyrinomonadaceae bacterium]|nr:ATP-binding protein [Pyrinomonadaceae bacterium]